MSANCDLSNDFLYNSIEVGISGAVVYSDVLAKFWAEGWYGARAHLQKFLVGPEKNHLSVWF